MRKYLFIAVTICLTLFFNACSSQNSNGDVQNNSGNTNDIVAPPQDEAESMAPVEIVLDTNPTTAVVLQFNTTKAPFDDINLRRAVSFGLDRKALCSGIKNSLPMYGMIPDGIPHALTPQKTYRETIGDMYDDNADFAKISLKNSGFELEEFVNSGYAITAKEGDTVAQTIMYQLMDKAGLVLKVNYLDAQSYEAALNDGNYDVILVDYPCAQDAKNYFSILGSYVWQNAVYAELVSDLDSYSNFQTGDKLEVYSMLEQVILEDMAYTPLFSIGNDAQ